MPSLTPYRFQCYLPEPKRSDEIQNWGSQVDSHKVVAYLPKFLKGELHAKQESFPLTQFHKTFSQTAISSEELFAPSIWELWTLLSKPEEVESYGFLGIILQDWPGTISPSYVFCSFSQFALDLFCKHRKELAEAKKPPDNGWDMISGRLALWRPNKWVPRSLEDFLVYVCILDVKENKPKNVRNPMNRIWTCCTY